jgi:hypothetical protein
MKERSVRELSGEIWAELHAVIDSRRDRGDHIFGSLDCQSIDAAVDVITGVLARNTGKTIVADDDQPTTPLMALYSEERARKRRQSAKRLGITLQ